MSRGDLGRSWADLGSIWVAQGGAKMSTASGQKRCDVELIFEVKLMEFEATPDTWKNREHVHVIAVESE